MIASQDYSSKNDQGQVRLDAATPIYFLAWYRVHGLECIVQTEDRRIVRCAVRGLLKSLSTDDRHVIVAGDRVMFRPEGEAQGLSIVLKLDEYAGPNQQTKATCIGIQRRSTADCRQRR